MSLKFYFFYPKSLSDYQSTGLNFSSCDLCPNPLYNCIEQHNITNLESYS